ncbi:hypothetical protein ABTX60_05090 [Streptomyces sp. NPDC126510]|uniref:hypothetical protein n=1 Tax=Streptomyces sp. NPDC126510 TaxID=3155317 RepID=UPI00332F3B03
MSYITAWDAPATRRAWMKLVVCAVLGQVLWPTAWVGLLAWYVSSPTWTLWLFFAPMLYAFYRTCLQPAYILWALRARRLLRVYPWQIHMNPESGIGKIPDAGPADVWLKFPDPDRPNETVGMVMRSHLRAVFWARRLGPGVKPAKAAQVEEIWFAGDPRFAGVIAAPGPRRLYVICQRLSYRGIAPGVEGASLQAVEHARRAGVRVEGPSSTAPGAVEA